MENILRAIALGVIQGLTEFLPISSSGHLIVARELFGWDFADDLTFDVALHLGTTAAVIAFFWNEWLDMLRSGCHWLRHRDFPMDDPHQTYDARLLFVLAIGSIPAAIVGVFFEVAVDVRSPVIVGIMLIIFAVVLYFANRFAQGHRQLDEAQPADAGWVGGAQAVSLVPGVSRSGVTISAAMARGFTREQAARFSFLLATPAILGAGLLKSLEAVVKGVPSDEIDAIVVGALVSAVVGWLSIRFLLRILQTGTLVPFVVYRLVAGIFIVLYFSL